MKKILIFLMSILTMSLNVNGQIFYNNYTKYNPYYGDSQTYSNKTNNDEDGKRFEIGIIVMGVGLVTMLAATYSYSSYRQSYYSYGYTRETNYPVFFTGLALTGTGLIITLKNSGNKKIRNKDNDIFYQKD